MPELAQQLTEACGPGMPGPYGGVKGKQSATGRNPSGAAAPPPFDKGGRERRGQDPSLRNGRFNGSRRKACGPGMPGPYGQLKESGNGREHRSDAVELSPDRQKCPGLRR